MVDAFLTLLNGVHCNETLAPSFWTLSVTCDHALLTTSACINLCVQLRTITTNARYRKPYYYAFAKLHAVRPSGYY